MGSLRNTKTSMTINHNDTLKFQHSLLYGSLLGDAYLYKNKGIIQLEQSFAHKEYLFWLFENLQSLTTGKTPMTLIDKRTGVKTQSYRFYTCFS